LGCRGTVHLTARERFAHNTVPGAAFGGILVYDVISGDGKGDPPYEFPTGVGPSQNLLEGNLVNGTASRKTASSSPRPATS
jgi:hypothetical protein